MIKAVTVINYLGDAVRIVLKEAEPDHGLLLTSITGLGPAKANVNTTDLSLDDGSIFNSATLDERNIVIAFSFTGDIETTRQNTYRYFPIKKELDILIETDNLTITAHGVVESNEPDIWSDKEGCSISIICPDPYFYSIDEKSDVVSRVRSGFKFPFSAGTRGVRVANKGKQIEKHEWPEKDLVGNIEISSWVNDSEGYYDDFILKKVEIDGVEYTPSSSRTEILSIPEKGRVTVYLPDSFGDHAPGPVNSFKWIYNYMNGDRRIELAGTSTSPRYFSISVPEDTIGGGASIGIRVVYRSSSNIEIEILVSTTGTWISRDFWDYSDDLQPLHDYWDDGRGFYMGTLAPYYEPERADADGEFTINNVNVTDLYVDYRRMLVRSNIQVYVDSFIQLVHNSNRVWGYIDSNSQRHLFADGDDRENCYFLVPHGISGSGTLVIVSESDQTLNKYVDYLDLDNSTGWIGEIEPDVVKPMSIEPYYETVYTPSENNVSAIDTDLYKYTISLKKNTNIPDVITDITGHAISADECIFTKFNDIGSGHYEFAYDNDGKLAIKDPYSGAIGAKLFVDSANNIYTVKYYVINLNYDPLIKFGDILAYPFTNIVYEGTPTTDTVIEIVCLRDISTGEVSVYNDVSKERITIDTSLVGNSGLLRGDVITINSVKNQKKIQLNREGVIYNILNAVERPLTWIHLVNGNNYLFYTDPSNNESVRVTVYYRTTYEGV